MPLGMVAPQARKLFSPLSARLEELAMMLGRAASKRTAGYRPPGQQGICGEAAAFRLAVAGLGVRNFLCI